MPEVKVARWDLRVTAAWLRGHWSRPLYVFALLAFSGLASVMGWLKWQPAFMRWSFAVVCWTAACVVVSVWLNKRTEKRRVARF